MDVVYVIQVMAYHGYGLEGWRTVRKASGEPYCFSTYDAAQAALRQHFSNLRAGLNVRVHTLPAALANTPLAGVPPTPATGDRRQDR